MTDREAAFAVRLSRSVGRVDWWNVKAEHTPYQWQLQRLMFELDPPGDQRNDLRSAIHTANVIASLAKTQMTAEQFAVLVKSLVNVTPLDRHDPDVMTVDAEALKVVKGGNA